MRLVIFHKMSPTTKSLLNGGEETMERRLVLRRLSLFPSLLLLLSPPLLPRLPFSGH